MLLEVRPSEGGDDSVAFAGDLFNALISFTQNHGCSVRSVQTNSRTLTADTACEHLHVLSGVHRIQRIPRNDSRGRRHTSTVTVALIAEQKPVIIDPDLEDQCEIKTCRSSGNGGQHAQKNDTAVMIRHRPSGIVVRCEAERSQWQNKQTALTELTERLVRRAQSQAAFNEQKQRKAQIATGERPVKQLTWNTQRDEVLDHTTGQRWRYKDAIRGKFAGLTRTT